MTDTSAQLSQLRKLLRNEWLSREEANQTHARTLHNQVGQQLTVMKMHLNLVEMNLENRPEDEFAEIQDRLSAIEETINSLADDIRGMVTELWPEVLDHFGLVAALDWKITKLGKETDVRTSVVSAIDQLPLSKKVERVVFRVVSSIMQQVVKKCVFCKVMVEESEKLVDIIIAGEGNGLSELVKSREYTLWRTEQREFLGFAHGEIEYNMQEKDELNIVLSIPID